jgi:phosphatidylglycerophosphate synthase
MRALPNAVTLSRIPLGLLCAWQVLAGSSEAALVLFLLAALTDFLDGTLARRLRAETRLGAILEPVADAFYVVPTLFALNQRHGFLTLPVVLALLALLALWGLLVMRMGRLDLWSALHAYTGLAYAVALAYTALRLAADVSEIWFWGVLVFLAVALLAKRDRAREILLPPEQPRGC